MQCAQSIDAPALLALAVNAARLSRSKEHLLKRYRTFPEGQLPGPLPDTRYNALVRAGIVIRARMLLWSRLSRLKPSVPVRGRNGLGEVASAVFGRPVRA
jgi:hypothetical protein